ncbi:hypothetical protein [Novosphingobium panipatense]|uniref:Uncharacterized protein n=1 Tax=Novosphingobium panipatense TaxID=428991 RepID=A0ABY1Q3N9_9SPHN|nr:hypothetical protein [Novosphingobium panipatense]SMP58398.1 hypothetical protein SAMN06296065_102463 [Novosphingobium panipatense]
MTAQERYDMIDEALTNVLRAGKVEVTDQFMYHMQVYERCVRAALDLPSSAN